MENKEMEIPFGAKDSELRESTYHIPDGMEAIIEGDKVIIRKKESEDERIREELISLVLKVMGREKDNLNDENYDKMLDWLEKQSKENMIEALRMEYEKGKADEREQFEKERLAQCDALTQEQAEIESEFVVNHIKKYNCQPTFIDAIEYGMKLQEQKLSNLESNGENWSEEDEKEWRDIINKFTWMEWFDELNFLRHKLNR